MPSSRDIKRKINSIAKTQQITKAMKMVAAAKLRKVQHTAMQFRPYIEKFEEIIKYLSEYTPPQDNKFLFLRDVKAAEIIVVASDKGLCGGFNHNIIKETENLVSGLSSKNISVSITVVGKKVHDYFHFKGIEIKHFYTGLLKDEAHFVDAKRIMNVAIKDFLEEKTDEVYIVYNKFVNMLIQRPTVKKVLPISFEEENGQKQKYEKFTFEPSKEMVLDQILLKYIQMSLYDSFLESLAGEYAARMLAMEAATKNAQDMIKKLTLFYNKARQAAITKELIEITTSIEAMK
ncbi:ATP synthase F1 subunit gamma [Desulfurella sp.]|uniref:ATP synthase F1 subunit gamma n=1 Tax=Desulfurella sp. TaxID=1962857 RepID=UPI0025BC9DA4|nr:ATP synthase F1 subunit gamma [Desulfurella sp.]